MDGVKEKYYQVKERIKKTCEACNRNVDDVTLVAVTKTVDVDTINQIVDIGEKNLGENRIQEFLEKEPFIQNVKWHIIGHLQSNKVKYVVGKDVLIHSVDSFKLLREINLQAEKRNVIQDVLLEVNISGEKSKYGLTIEELGYIMNRLEEVPYVRVRGLMTMAPLPSTKDSARVVFRGLKREFDLLNDQGFNLEHLSMGMSNDFETAIEEGATIVRVGSAIFK